MQSLYDMIIRSAASDLVLRCLPIIRFGFETKMVNA